MTDMSRSQSLKTNRAMTSRAELLAAAARGLGRGGRQRRARDRELATARFVVMRLLFVLFARFPHLNNLTIFTTT